MRSALILLVCAFSALTAQAQQTYPVEPNTNRPGSDILDFDLVAADPELCLSACINTLDCKSWTYVEPGLQGEKAHCWLKGSVPEARSHSCCTSGVKPTQLESGVDRPGNDYDHFQIQGGANACAARCTEEARCVAWTFGRLRSGSGGYCWLKDRVPSPVASARYTSGVKWQYPNGSRLVQIGRRLVAEPAPIGGPGTVPVNVSGEPLFPTPSVCAEACASFSGVCKTWIWERPESTGIVFEGTPVPQCHLMGEALHGTQDECCVSGRMGAS